MHAAVVTRWGPAPRYEERPNPVPAGEDEMVVDVLAAGLHPRVRSQAAGSHYTSTDELPLVPGIDGVGRGSDGRLRYFVLPATTMGSMADQTVIDTRRSVALPASTDVVALAAAMNPAMSSWVALRRRAPFRAGQHVLVLGATGNAGQMAVQVARLFGAGQVIGAGRNVERLAGLATLGATTTVLLDDDAISSADRVGQAAADVDVVVDYLWGEPAAVAMVAVLTNRADRGQPLTWAQIGSVAGATAPVPSAALRAVRFQIVGSGQGSVSADEYLAELPALVEAISAGTLTVNARAMPLSDVQRAWAGHAGDTQRIVLVP